MRLAFLILLTGCTAMAADGYTARLQRDTSEFVLVKESNGISVYERWYAITPDEFAREVKATFAIKATTHAAIALIRDETKGTRWNKNTKYYRVISHDEDAWYGYIQYDLPWPASNQDCVLRYQRSTAPSTVKLDFAGAVHPAFPISAKIDRIPRISGKWIFTEMADRVRVEYYVTTTRSATLPTWITDPIIRHNLIETLAAFRRMLECP